MQLREHIQAPYTCYNGIVLNERECKDYNDIQDDINRWINAGKQVPEWLIEWSFRYFRDHSESRTELPIKRELRWFVKQNVVEAWETDRYGKWFPVKSHRDWPLNSFKFVEMRVSEKDFNNRSQGFPVASCA